jgi:hypothetical protein
MMGVQFIFVVETNKTCKSDWIYIKDTIEHFYAYDRTSVKFSPVYMDGKGNYRSKKTEKEIISLISQYKATSKKNQSKVIYCFDCDEYSSNSDDWKFLEDARQYCENKGYDFVWFCKDIEQVYLGQEVDDNQKKKASARFKEKKLIVHVQAGQLSVNDYQENTSNILNVFDQFPELKRKDKFMVPAPKVQEQQHCRN